MPIQRTDTIIDQQINNSNEKRQKQEQKTWGKLVAISTGTSSFQLKKQQITIGRHIDCIMQIKQMRLSNNHCTINKKQRYVTIIDTSSNGTFVNNNRITKNVPFKLKQSDQIWLLPATKANVNNTIGFRLELYFDKIDKQQQELKKRQQQKKKRQLQIQALKEQQKQKSLQLQKIKQQQKIKQELIKKENSLTQKIKDQITCSFCFQIMYIPVNVTPCNHRFCGACLTELIIAKKQQCIQCRKDMKSAVRDSTFNSIIQDYLKNNPDEKRSDKEQEQARNKNIFGHDPVDIQERIHGKKKAPVKSKAIAPSISAATSSRRGRTRLARTTSDLSASDDDQTVKCRQCVNQRNGFKCNSSQIHMACHTCGKLMANRQNPSLHQYCILCTTNFCNLYYPPCARSGVKLDLIQNKKGGVKIDAQLLRGNKFQYDFIKNYLLSKKQSSKDVFDFILGQIEKKKFSYIFDRKIMKIPPLVSKQVLIQPQSAVCDLCWKDLWFQMVFAYKNIKANDFPEAIRNRPICYWGINCRTMEHNEQHAKKYSHFIFQTRFS